VILDGAGVFVSVLCVSFLIFISEIARHRLSREVLETALSKSAD
jgi:hypothetical protein